MEGGVFCEGEFPELSSEGKSVNIDCLGRNVPFAVVKRVCLQLWDKRGLTQVLPAGPKRILLKFETEGMMDTILNRSDWHIAGCPVLLRKWSVGIQLSDQELGNVPCWVQLSGIPLELWHKEGIIYLASVLGVPLKVDARSEKMANIGTAGIQVTCSAVKELQKTIEVEGEEGTSIKVAVYYENIPLRCQKCKVFGHSNAQCLLQRVGNRSRSRSRRPGGKRSISVGARRRNSKQPEVALQCSPSGNLEEGLGTILWRNNDVQLEGRARVRMLMNLGKGSIPFQLIATLSALMETFFLWSL
ncbi:hypothetical protein MLD38_036638 [Melastoma candidum]|uniref:Uncharacterized protein n=1 Tax=Melastoma candidum TaxID=119954 RepID=A0ACB9LLA5_9MYRT|nr:hypothetical protein MLD38_036638 [Melastoma candidum]